MVKKRNGSEEREHRPATSPDAREKQLVNLAVDLAEKQLRNGTASSSVITHYLKLASERERLERDILEQQKRLIEAKTGSLGKEGEAKKVAEEAVAAMKNYSSSS